MIKKRIIVLLLITMVCGFAYSCRNGQEDVLELQDTTYNEFKMQSIVRADSITKIEIFYEGKDYIISDTEQLEDFLLNWEYASLTKANVSLLKEDLPPGFLYSISMIKEDGESNNMQKFIFTLIRQEGKKVEIQYSSPDQKDYSITGVTNTAFEDFLEECMQVVQ